MIVKPIAYLLAALLLVSIVTNCTTYARLQAVRLELAQERQTQAEAARLLEAAARAAERNHAQAIDTLTRKAAHDRQVLTADLARLTHSLRERPERPASGAMPEGATSAMACTGAQLYRADSEFLAREAARADETRLQLAECQARYDAAVKLTQGEL